MKILTDIAGGGLSVTVEGDTITVESLELRNSVPPVIVQPANTTLYVGLGVGLGVGLILILAVAVILGVVVYIYRR